MDTDTQRLDKFEPELKRPIYKKYMKKILMFVTAMMLALYIILSNTKYIGTMKSQSLSSAKTTNFTFPMSHNLLPVHQFTVFDKQDILNRMECLINNRYEPCMEYCK